MNTPGNCKRRPLRVEAAPLLPLLYLGVVRLQEFELLVEAAWPLALAPFSLDALVKLQRSVAEHFELPLLAQLSFLLLF